MSCGIPSEIGTRTSGSLIPSAWPWMHAMDPIQSSPSLRAKSGWRTYHRLRRLLLEILGSLLIRLPQQTIQIITDEGWFFRDLFHERKSSGGTKTAGSRSRNRNGAGIFDRRSHIILSSSRSIGKLCPPFIL